MSENTYLKMQRHMMRILFSKPRYASHVNMAGKKVIVTGATPGSVGYETARILLEWGAEVTVTTRSRPEEAASALRAQLPKVKDMVHPARLDLANAKSVKGFADWYRDHQGEQLDVLINNAGIHLDLLSQWKEPKLSADGFETHWRTNYLGTFHLTHLLLPILQKTGKETRDARVVNVSSHLHQRGSNESLFSAPAHYNSWSAYGNSKLALLHHAFEIQRRFGSQYHLHGYALHPGSIATHISGRGLEGTGMIQQIHKALAPLEARILLSPEQGAQTQIHCATQPHLEGGIYYERCHPAPHSRDASDAVVASRLWTESSKWVEGL